MSINLHAIGRALMSSSALANSSPGAADLTLENELCQVCEYSSKDGAEDDDALLGDTAWLHRHEARKEGKQSEPGAAAFYAEAGKSHTPMTPLQFAQRCREARNRAARVFVILHLFAGVPRPGDIEAHFRDMAEPHNFEFVFCSVDLLTSPDWDLSQPWLFDLLPSLIEEGLIDIVLGGPPCSTWSALRWLPGGPRPLRYREICLWGRPDLTKVEQAHVALANVLALNTLALMESASTRGGAHLLEHPADPLIVQPWNKNPIASLFATEEFLGFQRRTGSIARIFDQCMVGGVARKRTCMSSDLEGFGPGLTFCDGGHTHGRSSGKDSEGRYVSARLATYPSELWRLIAVGWRFDYHFVFCSVWQRPDRMAAGRRWHKASHSPSLLPPMRRCARPFSMRPQSMGRA